MRVVFDNSVLCLLLHPEADVPTDPATGAPVTRPQDRIAHLVEQLREQKARILIPAPVLAEFLTVADPAYLDEINASQHFEVVPFDQRAAVEAAVSLRADIAEGRGKTAGSTSNWQKVKIDRQVVAIAKVREARAIYTTDRDIRNLAALASIPCGPVEAARGFSRRPRRASGSESTSTVN